jgi:hypothetical protein
MSKKNSFKVLVRERSIENDLLKACQKSKRKRGVKLLKKAINSSLFIFLVCVEHDNECELFFYLQLNALSQKIRNYEEKMVFCM